MFFITNQEEKDMEKRKIKSFKHFNSLAELVDVARSREPFDNARRVTIYGKTQSEDFTLTRDMAHADQLAEAGWSEGVIEFETGVQASTEGLNSYQARTSEYDICGPITMSGEFCSGNPECMFNPAQTENRPVVRLLVDSNMTCSIDTSQSIRRGAAIVALAKLLEDSGKTVEIIASCTAHANGPRTYAVTCKRADGDFDIHSLSYCLAHPSFYRRHGFRIWAHYGCTQSSSERTDWYDSFQQFGKVDCYFPCINQISEGFHSQEAATAYVIKTARKAGLIE